MDLRPTTIIRRNEKAVFRRLADGSGVILHLDSTAYHGLSAVGSVIWNLLDRPRSLAELTDGVRGSYDDAPTTVDRDVAEFLVDLEQRDLVSFEDRAP